MITFFILWTLASLAWMAFDKIYILHHIPMCIPFFLFLFVMSFFFWPAMLADYIYDRVKYSD